jgi:hypothetical protein
VWNTESNVYVMFKIKYGVNKMHSITSSQQVGWFDGKGIDIHPWGLRMKLHKWHDCGQQWYVDHTYLT